MFERFTNHARRVVVVAQEETRASMRKSIGSEHFLLALIQVEQGVAAQVLKDLKVDADVMRRQVEELSGRGSEEHRGHIPFTPVVKKALERSLHEALTLGHNYVGTEHLLLALVRDFPTDDERRAIRILAEMGVLGSIRQAVYDKLKVQQAEKELEDRKAERRRRRASRVPQAEIDKTRLRESLGELDHLITVQSRLVRNHCRSSKPERQDIGSRLRSSLKDLRLARDMTWAQLKAFEQ